MKAGRFVNIASVLALEVIGHLGPYAASKGGIWQVTKTMALELARHKVRVNALAPGYNRDRHQPRLPSKRDRPANGQKKSRSGAMANQRTWTAHSCCSPRTQGRYITGSIIVVDGGFTLQ